jgi:hypothetical protein
MKWIEILIIILSIAQIVFGAIGFSRRGKFKQGKDSKLLYEKYGGEWVDDRYGGTWYEKAKKTHVFWYLISAWCICLLLGYILVGLAIYTS